MAFPGHPFSSTRGRRFRCLAYRFVSSRRWQSLLPASFPTLLTAPGTDAEAGAGCATEDGRDGDGRRIDDDRRSKDRQCDERGPGKHRKSGDDYGLAGHAGRQAPTTAGWNQRLGMFPNSPTEFKAASVDDPMCLDKQWQGWADAWMAKKSPAPAERASPTC